MAVATTLSAREPIGSTISLVTPFFLEPPHLASGID
jgi:hypothetical protein